jgi:PEP-CTERM motif-containing protein
MLRILARRAILALALVFAYGGPANAGLIQFQGTTPDGPVDATADFTLGNGTLKIVLTDLLKNPTSDGQLISGISFTVSGALGSSVLTSASGLDSSVDTKHGTYTAGVLSSLPQWKLLSSGDLTTLSGKKPNELIIGPDDHGGFDPTLGKYSDANPSISQHNPVVLGIGTFDLSIPGITGSSIISDVSMQFGTTPYSLDPVSVPEPSTLTLSALSIVLMGLAMLRRKLA